MPEELANQISSVWAAASLGALLLGGLVALLRPFIPSEDELERRVGFARDQLITKLGSHLQSALVSHGAELIVEPTEHAQQGTARGTSETVEEWAAECYRGLNLFSDLQRLFRTLTNTHQALFGSICVAVGCFLGGFLFEELRPLLGVVAIVDVVVQLCIVARERAIVRRFRERENAL